MAADDPNQKEPVVREAEQFKPAREESSRSFADEYLKDLFSRAKTGGDNNKPDSNYDFHQGGNKPESKPDNYDFHPDGTAVNASRDLQKLFEKTKGIQPGENQAERFDQGNGVLRVVDDKTAQYVDASGRVTTCIDENTCIEYDPKTQGYTCIGKDGKREPVTDQKQIDQYKSNPIGTESVNENGAAGQKKTYLDGRVTTTIDKPKPGELAERTTYPPGQKDGIRQEEKFAAKEPAENNTQSSARTVKTYEDRKETSFEKGDIKSVTAFKNADKDHPSVVTEYRDNKGPKSPNDPNGPGASRVETYKDDGNPNGVKQIAQFRDGDKVLKPDQMTFRNGMTVDCAPNGDIRTQIGQGDKTAILDINKDSGMPTHMRIGDRDYEVKYGKDGRVEDLKITGGNPPETLELHRNDKGELEVKTGPKDGKIKIEGIEIDVKDGKIVGDIHVNKSGDIRYKNGEGPERHEIVRKADGSTEDYDFKNWKRTITGADNKSKEEHWDGYEWRGGKLSADGKRIEFSPPDPKKPSYIERSTSGNPPQDVTTVAYPDGKKIVCDWKNQSQTEVSPDGKQTTRYYDGATYREGQLSENAQHEKIILFKEPVPDNQPVGVVRHEKGNITSHYKDGTRVEKNLKGDVTEVNGPKGVWKFERDGDGDLSKAVEYEPDGKTVRNSYTRTGQEKDPGMEQWLNRGANDAPRQPTDKAPRDPNAPKDYNTWVDKDGRPIAGLNIHTTADGTVRMEKAAGDGKGAELKVIPPVGDSYRDSPTQRITDKPGGVTEIIDKTKNPPVGTLEFKRNGQPFKISSADGPYNVESDGTVAQNSKDGKTTSRILPDGSIAKFENTAAAKPGDLPTQKLAELKIAKPNADASKPGEYETFKPGVPPVKSIEELPLPAVNQFKVVTTDQNNKETQTVYDLKNKLKSEQRDGDKFARVSSMENGKPVGIDVNGTRILNFNPDGSATGLNGRKYEAKDWNVKPEDVQTGPNGEMLIKGKNGKDTALFKANGVVVENRDGKEKTIYPNNTEATFENGKLKTYTMNGKEYEPVLTADGKISSLKPKGGGDEIKANPPGSAYSINENGEFVAESKDDKNKTSTRMQWDPVSGNAQLDKSWTGADNKPLYSSVMLDKTGAVLAYKIPRLDPSDRSLIPMQEAKKQWKDVQAEYRNGKLTVQFDAEHKVVINEDGSTDFTIGGKNGQPDVVNHRNPSRQLQATETQASTIATLAEKAATDQQAQQQLANEIMNRFKFVPGNTIDADMASFASSLNEGALKALGISVAIQKTGPGKFNVVLNKGGKATPIAWSAG